jgi:uncharacterized protein involved in outer membrane biogenesis
VLALSAALVAPYFVDWTTYRADFEREASRILGREVTVRGSATARLLPFPSVSFTDVVVAGVEPGETAMTIETFSMDAELAPFMRGDLLIFDMRLVRPDVVIDVAADGRLDWAVRPSVPVEASHISLEKLTVTEGRVSVRQEASGRTHQLTEINADISARALTGPWRLDGSLRIDGWRTDLSATTGAVDENGRMRVRLRAQPELYPFVLETDGSAQIEDGRGRLAGQFKLNASTTKDRLRVGEGGTFEIASSTTADTAGPPPYRFTGSFELDHQALTVDEFRFATGPLDDPYTAEGSAQFDLGNEPSFAIRADGSQIRFEEGISGEGTSGVSLEQRFVAFREFLIDLPRPTIPGTLDLALPAIVAGDTTVRDVRVSASPSPAGWAVASLAATLPGRATFEAKGELSLVERIGFDGSLLLAIGQPSGFAAWLSRDVNEAIRRLPAAGFSAKVALREDRQTFRDLELMLGAAKFRGEIDSNTPAGRRSSMALRLDGDKLDVEGMAAFASLFVSDGGETRLAERDLEFDISAGPVTAAGLEAATLDTSLRLLDGQLNIERLELGGLAEADISATGTVRDLAGQPTGTLDAKIVSPDLAVLADALASRFADNRLVNQISERASLYPGLLDDASLQLVVNASASDVGNTGAVATLSGEIGGTTLTMTGTTNNVTAGVTRAGVNLNLNARNDDAAALYAAMGLPALPIGLAGAAEMQAVFDGNLQTGGQAQFSFVGDGLALSYNGEAAFDETGFSGNGSVSFDSNDVEPWLAIAGISLPGYGLGLPIAFTSQIDIDDGLYLFSGLTGEISGEAASGDLNVQSKDGLPHVTGGLSLRTLDLSALAEIVVGSPALDGDGVRWPTAPFAQSVSTAVSTDLDLSAETLLAGPFGDASNASLQVRIGREGLSLSDVSASIAGGRLSGIFDFRNDGGTGLLSSQLRLENASVPALLGGNALAGTVDLTATVTGSGKSVDGVIASLAGSGTASVRDLGVTGVNPSAFAALLEAADHFGPEVDAQATAQFAPALVRGGTFQTDALEFAFTVANGVARVPPLRLGVPEASLSAELRADFAASTIGADAVLTFQPGPEALVGSEPSVRFSANGPLDDVTVQLDTGPLTQFLTQRALELEQQRVEAMQAALLERQRHRRETRYYASLADQRAQAAEEARRAAERSERLKREARELEEEAARRAAEQDRLEREEEAERLRLEEEKRLLELEKERAKVDEEQRAEAARREAQARSVSPQPAGSSENPADEARDPLPGDAAPGVTTLPSPRPVPPPLDLTVPQPPSTISPAGESSRDGFLQFLFGN